MSRNLSALNIAEVDASHYHCVVLVKLEYDTPAYFHSGIGSITYDSNEYVGVGRFGNIGQAKETEALGPSPLTLTISGVDSAVIADALDSGKYGDVITIYEGYRQDDGTLVADPWIIWRGTLEYADAGLGDNNVVNIHIQNDLAVLNESDGSKFTDEDQQANYSGDLGFEFVSDAINVQLRWGGASFGEMPWQPRPPENTDINGLPFYGW